MNIRRIIIVLAVLLLALGGFAAWKIYGEPDQQDSTAQDRPALDNRSEPEGDGIIRLIASGDMLPHDTVNLRAKSGNGYDYRQFFSEVKPVFDGADIVYCNQEVPSAGEALGISGYPTFNAPTEFARDLSGIGCNLINLANNHINDKGQKGIDRTLETWDKLEVLAVAGANRSSEEQRKVRYFTHGNIRFAFVAYAEYSNDSRLTPYGLNILNEELVKPQLTEARDKADIVIVSAHWGTEFSERSNQFQRRWAKTFADLGADIVIGNGPHVLQPADKLPRAGGGETLVWYSLGNMLSTQIEKEALIGGFAIMDIDTDTKKVTDVRFLPSYMHYEWTAEEKAEEDLLARKNLKIYPLDQAAGPLQRSLFNTSVDAELERVRKILNTHIDVEIISLPEY